jgi:hypothetical protein
MVEPFRRRLGWWYTDSSDGSSRMLYQWKRRQWQPRQDMRFPPPPFLRLRLGQLASEPLVVYVFGVLAALLAVVITAAMVDDNSIAAVLAPVMGVIGAFTGHAAGHSSAVRAMKEERSAAQVPPPLVAQRDVGPSAGASGDQTAVSHGPSSDPPV